MISAFRFTDNVIYLGMFRLTNIGIATIFATIVAPDESLHIRITADRVYSAKHTDAEHALI